MPESLDHVRKYVRFSRAAAISRAQRTGRYDAVSKLIVAATSYHPAIGHVLTLNDGSTIPADTADEATRLRLFSRDSDGRESPLMVFLGNDGMPMTSKGWNKVCSQANKRLKDEFVRLDLPVERTIHISPHSLRFSFALYLLVALHRRIDTLDQRDANAPYDERFYEGTYNTVRDLLGHASAQTTKDTYLEPVKGLRRSLLSTRTAALSDLNSLIDRIAEGSESILDRRTLAGDL